MADEFIFKPKIVIIDSGISKNANVKNVVGGIEIVEEEGVCNIEASYDDEIGHGTAVADIMNQFASQSELFIIKLFTKELTSTEEKLEYALEYIEKNVNCDIIHMSIGMGAVKNIERLTSMVNKLYNQGKILVAAYDNNGSLSYPAILPAVIGVDINTNYTVLSDYDVIYNSMINIRCANTYFRTKWLIPERNIVRGTSYSAAYITSLISNILTRVKKSITYEYIYSELEHSASNVIQYSEDNDYDGIRFVSDIKKAIVFPFNKEMHSLAAFYDLLDFTISGFYDIKYCGKIGKRLDQFIHNYQQNDKEYILKNYSEIDWSDNFDTVICGHCEEINKLIGHDFRREMIEKCREYNKRLYMFDDPRKYYSDCFVKNKELFFPSVESTENYIHNYGKLYNSAVPIVGIFGTNTSQGKFSLQLLLRRELLKRKFRVGQLGTEPSGFLFNFNKVYPMGYNSSTYVGLYPSIQILNYYMHFIEIEAKPDLIIVGSQSGTISYDYQNVNNMPIPQYSFILGVLPDIVILNVNYFDDIDYIERTIKFIESVQNCKVIALVLYPITKQFSKNGLRIRKIHITEEEKSNFIIKLEKTLKIKIFDLELQEHLVTLTDMIIGEFSESE